MVIGAHHDGHGSVFHGLTEIRPEASITLETHRRVLTYQVDRIVRDVPYSADPDLRALVPASSGYTRPGHYLTLFTCMSVWEPDKRLLVFASLRGVADKAPAGRVTVTEPKL